MHYVPQTYLKKFSKQKGKAYFIDALPIASLNPSDIKSINVKNICVVNNLYLMPGETVEQRQLLETMYSDLYEKDYTRLYSLLTDPNKDAITLEERYSIIGFVVAMFFRNLSWHNFLNKISDDMVERGYHLTKENGKEAFFIEDREVLIKDKTVEQIKKEERERGTATISIGSATNIFELIRSRVLDDIITVVELKDDNEFITSDNPVYCKGETGRHVVPMDATNSLALAIDNKHLLELRPWSSQHGFDTKTLWRTPAFGISSFAFTLSYNERQLVQTNKFALGTESGLRKHLISSAKYR
jgi:hypothetical protein